MRGPQLSPTVKMGEGLGEGRGAGEGLEEWSLRRDLEEGKFHMNTAILPFPGRLGES